MATYYVMHGQHAFRKAARQWLEDGHGVPSISDVADLFEASSPVAAAKQYFDDVALVAIVSEAGERADFSVYDENGVFVAVYTLSYDIHVHRYDAPTAKSFGV